MKELTIKYLPELPFAVEESINWGFAGTRSRPS